MAYTVGLNLKSPDAPYNWVLYITNRFYTSDYHHLPLPFGLIFTKWGLYNWVQNAPEAPCNIGLSIQIANLAPSDYHQLPQGFLQQVLSPTPMVYTTGLKKVSPDDRTIGLSPINKLMGLITNRLTHPIITSCLYLWVEESPMALSQLGSLYHQMIVQLGYLPLPNIMGLITNRLTHPIITSCLYLWANIHQWPIQLG
jgi:hypothetical protein